MKGEELLYAMEYIDADLIEAADKSVNKRRKPYWVAAVAAMLMLTIGIGLYLVLSPAPPVVQGTQPADLPMLGAPQSPHTLQFMNMVAAPKYPEMVPYPNKSGGGNFSGSYSDAYNAWLNDQYAQYDQPRGYADNMTKFFQKSIPTFLNTSENSTYSPLNVYMALAMLAETTDGDSRQQILELLGSDSIEALRQQVGHVWNAHYCNDGVTTMLLGNSLWLSDRFDFRQECMDTLANTYYTSAFHGTMGSDSFDQQLQQWLNSQTGGLLADRIDNIKMDANTVLALASTVYFSAGWGDTFSAEDTKDMAFHCSDKDLMTPFMCMTFTENYYYSDNFGAVSLSLSGYNNMWLILPDKGHTVEEILESDEYFKMVQAPSNWKKQKMNIKITLELPKFDVSSNLELSNGLKNLGISNVFDQNASDFSALIEHDDLYDLYVDRIEHAARVRIDEDGCIGTAYTFINFYGGAAPPSNLRKITFTLDRPFLFLITSRDQLPLFAGVVVEP